MKILCLIIHLCIAPKPCDLLSFIMLKRSFEGCTSPSFPFSNNEWGLEFSGFKKGKKAV